MQTDSGLTFRRCIFIEKKHYFFEVELLRLNLLTKLLLVPKACFSPSNAGLNIKIRQLVSKNGRLKDDYLVKMVDIPTVNVCGV